MSRAVIGAEQYIEELEAKAKGDIHYLLDPYHNVAREVAELVIEKQKAYGDSFSRAGEVMKILYPDGISHSQMDEALCIIRVLDKLFRVATMRDAFGESPWRDIIGYALLAEVRVEREAELRRDPAA